MATEAKLSHTAAMILQALDAGFVYGFSIMEMTGLPSGTVYPAMRRLERDDLIRLAVGAPVHRRCRAEAAAQVLQAHGRRQKYPRSLPQTLPAA